jgi:hypothetical protein
MERKILSFFDTIYRALKFRKIRCRLAVVVSTIIALTPAIDGCSQAPIFTGFNSSRQNEIQAETEAANATPETTGASASTNDFSIDLKFEDTTEPLKLVLIIDDSSSMVPKQKIFADALEKALDTLRGKNVTIYLYSTSIFANKYEFFGTNYLNHYTMIQMPLDNSSSFAVWPGMHYANILSTTAKPSFDILPRLKKGASWIQPRSKNIDFIPDEAESKFVINRSAFDTASGAIAFTDNMTSAAFSALKSAMKPQLILGDRGHPEEMPLCTLTALLSNEGPNKIFSSGDRVAFVLISDEDHTTDPGLPVCPSSHKMTVTPKETTDVIAKRLVNTVYMDYQAKCDNTQNDGYCSNQPQLRKWHTGCHSNPLCNARTPIMDTWQTCSNEQKSDYLAYFSGTFGTQLASGMYRIDPDSECKANLHYSHVNSPFVSVKWDNLNPKPFSWENSSYDSIVDYFSQTFPNENFNGELRINPFFGTQKGEFIGINGVSTPQDLPQWIRKKSLDLFGQGNFTISVIGNTGHSDNPDCKTDRNAKSDILFSIADTKSSICEKDYTSSLTWMNIFASKKLWRTYAIDPKFLETDYELFIAIGDRQSKLETNQYSYDPSKSMLTLNTNIPFQSGARLVARRK